MVYQSRELLAMKLELESYLGNKALEEYYLSLPRTFIQNNPWLDRDLKRVQQNIKFIEQQVARLPDKERTFLHDIYFNKNSKKEIMKKYGLSNSSYHRNLDKAVYAFTQVNDE